MSITVELRDISLTLPGGRELLQNLSLSLKQGTTTALLGRSGSGKTTLLRLVNRMAAESSGSIAVNGAVTAQSGLVDLRRGIGYVIQETGLFPHFTIERNVQVVLEAQGIEASRRAARAREMLQAVGLPPESFSSRYPHQLSGGQRQRAGIARALAADPAILLMDEPFSALDPLTRAEMQDMLRTLLRRSPKTVLLVTHDLDEALFLADRLVLIEEGRIVADTKASEFLTSKLPAVQAYVQAYHRAERELSS